MDVAEFRSAFQQWTGNPPLRWQERLFLEYFADGTNGKPPQVIDLPTGLGKTMVMAIWLIARQVNKSLPRRLIYVVDRRTVVDQATDVALKLQSAVGKGELAISTLRGQLADNREWSRDPARPAIVIGTVDLIGSALLFSGYRSSFKRRPLEAGLLGQDSLLVLDEAHLAKPFEKLVKSIHQFQQNQGSPMQVIRMSATSGDSQNDTAFRLNTDPSSPDYDLLSDADPDTGEERNQVLTRFSAKKRLTIPALVDAKALNKTIYEHAVDIAANPSLNGKRVVVFVRSPDDAMKIAALIRNHEVKSEDTSRKKPKTIKSRPYTDSVEILTGTMRGLERDELIKKTIIQRFLDGDIHPADPKNQSPVFLVSTSAGEVGIDLNADHMVCDAAPLDSMIQRLGRVNRRGYGDAIIRLILQKEPAEKSDMQKACNAASDLFTEGMEVSPRALAEFKSTLSSDQLKAACSPEPTMVELTDILLDSWSMTSITEPMPGRPEVGPWLRGIEEEQAQTTVAWRAELELFREAPTPETALRAVFIKHPIRPHESLSVNTGHLLEFLKRIAKLKNRPSDLMSTRVAVRLPRGQVVCRTLQQLTDEPGILYADTTLILPTRFGGLDHAGVLDAESIPVTRSDDDAETPTCDVADHPGYEQRRNASPRLRVLIHHIDNRKWKVESLPGGVVVSERLQLEEYATSTLLFADLRKNDLRIRQVQPIEFDEEDDAVRSLIMLSPVSNKAKPDDQSLDDHVGAVEDQALRIANELDLKDPIRSALQFAARWHDEGKKADIWQRFVYGPDANGYKGKSSRTRDPNSLCGYRHELGSLLRIHDPDRCGTIGCVLPPDIDARELALHLIAAHHGMARPHFFTAVYRDFSDTERDAIHTDTIRRFARLHRKYGLWRLAWFENLLRCADALASADQDAEDDPADTEAGTA